MKSKINHTVKSILKYIVEIIIVAFGVFLGVHYSNINTDNKTQKEKEKSLGLIINELELNKLLLQKQILYHENIKIEMDSIVPTLSKKKLYSNFIESGFKKIGIRGWTGFNFARLHKTAFESTKTSGIIKELDIELIQKLSDSYYFQDLYIGFGTSILNKAIDSDSTTKTIDLVGIIQLMTSDLLGLEKQLLTKIENLLTELLSSKIKST